MPLCTVQVHSEFKNKILDQNQVYCEDLRLLTLKTKIWHNNVLSRRFGKYSFQLMEILGLFGVHFDAAVVFSDLQQPYCGWDCSPAWAQHNSTIVAGKEKAGRKQRGSSKRLKTMDSHTHKTQTRWVDLRDPILDTYPSPSLQPVVCVVQLCTRESSSWKSWMINTLPRNLIIFSLRLT